MKITYSQIMSLKPCYDPVEIGMPQDYEDTIVNFIKEYRYKVKSKIGIQLVLLRNEFLTNKELRLFAVWCVRQVQHLMKDEGSIQALDVAEAYANGNATDKELDDAWNVARDAAINSVRNAWVVGDAAGVAAQAVKDASFAAQAAFWAVRGDAVYAARLANAYAAWDAVLDSQIDRLIEIFESK